MKTIFITGMAIFFAISNIHAQTEQQQGVVKNDIKKLDKREARIRDKKKKDKIVLRKLEGQDASYQSKQQFISDFGDIRDVQWKRNDYFDEARFTKDGKALTAYYDIDGNLVGTTSARQFADLPAAGQKQINREYISKGYKVDNVIFYDDNEANSSDMILYGSEFEDEDSYFVELSKNNSGIVLHVTSDGNVFYFEDLH
ncbi:MAG: hypothetical protein J0H29_21720 [Sphingobacteriales bacterium]|nr:hypothetical protein [Sphingobacteriales bacterium]OJY80909.1 MAG: hypothetical protein BGP14_01590 [Sphingobacteriales bacterium 44-15]